MALTKKIFSQIGQQLSGAPSHATAARSETYGAPCSMASAHVILKLIRQRLRVAVIREEKWYPTILRVICH